MNNKLKKGTHCFVVCAYKESPYLEECIRSLKNQKLESQIVIATSTPNAWIYEIAEKYQIPVYENHGEAGIAGDWNFGISVCKSRFVTIAHQDDVYEPEYTEEIFKNLKGRMHPLIAFTDYGEIRNGKKCTQSVLLAVKRMLLIPLRKRSFQNREFNRRLSIAFGNSICCPSVTYCMDHLDKPIFETGFGSNLDWQTWEKLSRKKGEFVYIKKPLMYHRIHEGSTTSKLIGEKKRTKEDLDMLKRFWPSFLAELFGKIYGFGEYFN